MPAPRPRRISDFLPRMQNVAQTSHYLVKFALPVSSVRSYLRRKGINDRFVAEDAGLLVSDAVLPGSALASVNVAGDFQGVIERFAHTRNFTQINLEFYVDNDYTSLKFIEHWMEFITGASDSDPAADNYHFQLRYPSEYKSNETRIVKFERDYNRFLEYKFVGLFPLSLNSTRVSYQGSQVLKASAAFSFDRYICGESTSLVRDLLKAYNNIFGRGNTYDANNSRLSSFDPKSSTNGKLNQASLDQSSVLNSSALVQRMTTGGIGQVNNAAGQSIGTAGQVISG